MSWCYHQLHFSHVYYFGTDVKNGNVMLLYKNVFVSGKCEEYLTC